MQETRGRNKKPDHAKKKAHPIYATDTEWQSIKDKATERGLEVSPFIIQTVIQS